MEDAVFCGLLDELEKLGAVSPDEARRALDRLNTIEQNKPTVGQVAQYGALGAGAGALGRLVGSGIEHGAVAPGRGLLGAAAAGAIGMGAVPMIRQHLDRGTEYGKLKKFMTQGPQHQGEYGKNESAAVDAQLPQTGLSR